MKRERPGQRQSFRTGDTVNFGWRRIWNNSGTGLMVWMNMIVSRAWGMQAEDGADCPLTFPPVAITMETGSKNTRTGRGDTNEIFY